MTKPSITKAALALLLCGVAGVTPVLAGARESVREILSARHAISMTADDWRKLGADVDRHLIEAAGDAALNYGARQRAMSGLAVVGGPRAQEFLRVTIERS